MSKIKYFLSIIQGADCTRYASGIATLHSKRNYLKSRKGPDTVRSLSAGQRAQRPSSFVSNEMQTQSILFELDCYPLCYRWPAERLLTVSGPFLVEHSINPKQTMGGLNQDAAYSAASPCQMNKV